MTPDEVWATFDALPDFRTRDGTSWPWVNRLAVRPIIEAAIRAEAEADFDALGHSNVSYLLGKRDAEAAIRASEPLDVARLTPLIDEVYQRGMDAPEAAVLITRALAALGEPTP